MTNDEFNRKLSEVLGSGLKKYPHVVRIEREVYWPECLKDFTRCISDPVESIEDDQFHKLVTIYVEGNDHQRERVRSVCREALSLIVFADSIAVRALLGGGQHSLEAALLAVVMEDVAFDFRDSMMAMTAIRLAAERNGLDIQSAIKKAASCATKKAADFLHQFMQRPMEGLVHSMGLKEICDKNGPVLELGHI